MLDQRGLMHTALACVVALLLQTPAFAQVAADSTPALRIKSAFAGPIWRSDIDANEEYAVVSNSYDSVSTWALDLPEAGSISRVPILNEQKKRAHATALSPSAELVAYSTPPLLSGQELAYQPNSSRIYVLNRISGQIVKVLSGPDNDITTRPQAIRFSTDGKHLAAILSSGCGLRVWSTEDWRLIAKYDNSYGGAVGQDRCCRTNNIDDCDRRPDGNSLLFYSLGTSKNLLITSSDSGIHSFLLSGDELTPVAFASPQDLDLDRPAGISISRSGDYLAVGDRLDSTLQTRLRFRVALIDPNTLKPLRPPLELPSSALRFGDLLLTNPQTSGLSQFSLDRVAFLSIGSSNYIFAGTLPCQIAANISEDLRAQSEITSQTICILRWTVGQTIEPPVFIPVRTNRIMEILPLNRRGGILIVSQDMISLLAPDGHALISGIQRAFTETNSAADFRSATLDFAVSPDGRAIRFSDYQSTPSKPLTVTFNLLNVPHPISPNLGITFSNPDQDANIVQSWENSKLPLFNSQALPAQEITKDEIFRSVAIRQQDKLILLGSSEYLRLISYADNTPKVLCRLPITAEAYRVNFNEDGKLAITAHSDGTVRWHRIDYQQNNCALRTLLTVRFSRLADGGWTWIAWLPDGTHVQDFNAYEGLEWQTTTSTGLLVITPFERLQSSYVPDAIIHALDITAGLAHATPYNRDNLIARARPVNVIDVLPNPPSIRANSERVLLGLRLTDDQRWPKQMFVRVNNAPAQIIWNGKSYSANDPLGLEQTDLQNGRIELEVALPVSSRTVRGDIQICFYLNTSRDACHVMTWTGDLAKPSQRRLWAVFVGLSRYADTRINLKYAENDVIDLARLFVNDFETKSLVLKERYQEFHLNLAVAASPPAETELGKINSRPYVKRFEATKSGILAAINDIITARALDVNAEALSDDLFIFYFSGHGVISPSDEDQGRILLTTKDTQLNATPAELAATTIRSSDLLDLFENIPGHKLIIFDACRSLLPDFKAAAFDPNLVVSDLNNHAVSANVFFSSDVGQASREEPEPAFDHTRPRDRQGNGLFSYALLHALTTDVTILAAARRNIVQVRVLGIANYFDSVFFKADLPDGEAEHLMRKNNWADIQTPKFYPTRGGDTDQVVRTFVEPGR
jgi:hypothetical protein